MGFKESYCNTEIESMRIIATEFQKLGKISQDNGEYEKATKYYRESSEMLGEILTYREKSEGKIEYSEETRAPKIVDKFISEKKKNIIRVAAVQFDYELCDTFPYKIQDTEEERVKCKIENVIEKAHKEKVDILCLPELSVCENWLGDIKNQCKDMIIIAGTYYDKENHNVCQLITKSDKIIEPQLKSNPSSFEDSVLSTQRMLPGNQIVNIYETHFGKFAVLICRDFINFHYHLTRKTDIIFVPSFNPSNDRFHKNADTHVTESPSYIIISNTSKYGGTSIFGKIRKEFFSSLFQEGYKKKGDQTYKLCEIEKDKEGMIIADFNLIYKSPFLQAPSNYEEDIKPVSNIKRIIENF